jgi:hypothetical protein
MYRSLFTDDLQPDNTPVAPVPPKIGDQVYTGDAVTNIIAYVYTDDKGVRSPSCEVAAPLSCQYIIAVGAHLKAQPITNILTALDYSDPSEYFSGSAVDHDKVL